MDDGHLELKKTCHTICWRVTRDDEADEVARIVKEDFARNEPISVALGLGESEQLALACLVKDYYMKIPPICAYDKQTGDICGVCIVYEPTVEIPNDVQLPTKLSQISTFLDSFDKHVHSHAGEHQYINGIIMCVKQKYAKMGIAQALYKKRMDLSREDGCKYYFVRCTSKYTANALASLGAKCIAEVAYADYVDPITGEKIFRDMKEPHKSAKLMCLE